MFLPKTLKFRRGIRGIDWVICMCCRCSWNVSRNMCWWMCLWLGSQPVRARVGVGNALTASRLHAWHQNRWMPLIVTVCNVFNSIIPSLSLSLSIQHLSRLLTEAVCRKSELYLETAEGSHNFYLAHQENFHIMSWVQKLQYKVLTIMFLVCVKGMAQFFFISIQQWDEKIDIIQMWVKCEAAVRSLSNALHLVSLTLSQKLNVT